MKEDQGLVNYLTNIILRPHRQIYGIQKLGSSKFVVKSHEKSLSLLESMSQNKKNLPQQMQQNYCELIEVNRREVTIRNEGKCIQASVYEPQLTSKQKKCTQQDQNGDNNVIRNGKSCFSLQNKEKQQLSYENCVIFLHANSGSRIQGMQYAKYILQYRTLCVSFDYTGSGISEGQYTTMGVNQSKDLSAVIQYVAEIYNVKKFGLWGRSMGAVTGIYYLLTKYQEDVTKIRVTSCVIDSPFSDLKKLIIEIASKRSNFPKFVIEPFMNIIEKDIITKIGINIFTELNLVEKIKNLSPEKTKLLNSVSFLGLASKDDKMISYEHCEQLCELLIPKDVRNSELIDERKMILNNSSDKHLMLLVEFKKEIKAKGDFIEIEGDHNKPRPNEVKEKISFFIEDNFISYKDPFANKNNQPTKENLSIQSQKPIYFTKTGLSIKTKLAFTKALQNNGVKSRKDSQNLKDTIPSQKKIEQSLPGQNYNLINLKEFKTKQQAKQSLSREKESIRNSLNKNFLYKDRKQQNSSLQNGNKGLSIVSKEFHRQKIKQNQEGSNMSKTLFDKIQNSKNTLQNQKNYQELNSKSSFQSTFASFINNSKNIDGTPKCNDHNTSLEYLSNQRISQPNDSVNNSLTKQQSTVSGDQKHSEVIISDLNLSENSISSSFQYPNLTQRLSRPQKHFESLPSQRYNRNVQSLNYVYQNKLEQSPGVSTTPFNLSIDKGSNMSFEMQNSFQDESFRKKEISHVLDVTDLSFKKETPKTPQVKVSISEFRNRHEDESNNSNNQSTQKKYATKKENSFAGANLSTHWSLNNNQAKGPQSACLEDKLSNKQSFHQFRKKEPAETNSIHNSDMSWQQNAELSHQRSQHTQYTPNSFKPPTTNQFQVHISTKHPNVSSSFTQNCQPSMKQIMMSNGHRGMSQSTTFNNPSNHQNGYYPPQYPQYFYSQYQNGGQFVVQQGYERHQYGNGQNQVIGHQNGFVSGAIQSMRTSQDHYNHQIPHSYNTSQNTHPNQTIHFQNKPTSQSATYGTNQTINNFYNYHNPNQPPKQQIEYKNKITRLLPD